MSKCKCTFKDEPLFVVVVTGGKLSAVSTAGTFVSVAKKGFGVLENYQDEDD